MIKDIFTKKENQIMIGVIFISLIFIIFGLYSLNKKIELDESREIPGSVDEIIWKKYENKKYDFALSYPDHFYVNFDKTEFGPFINFYSQNRNSKEPIDNFRNISHFSIYPRSIDTLNSEHYEYFETFDYTNQNDIDFLIREYKKQDGTVWAIQAVPKSVPDSWLIFGFIWISSEIKNKETVCLRGTEKIDINICNPLEGDQFYVEGQVDKNFIEISRNILDSFNFN